MKTWRERKLLLAITEKFCAFVAGAEQSLPPGNPRPWGVVEFITGYIRIGCSRHLNSTQSNFTLEKGAL